MSLRVKKIEKVCAIAATLLTFATSCAVYAADKAPATPEISPVLKKGYAQLKKADYRGAITTFREAVKQNVNDPLSRRCLAYALLCSGDPEDALEQLILLTRLSPPAAADWNTFGEVYLIAESYGQAEDAFREALKTDENNFWARCGVIRSKAMQRDFKSAYMMLAELITDTPDERLRRYLYGLRINIRKVELTPEPVKIDRPDVTPQELEGKPQESPGA